MGLHIGCLPGFDTMSGVPLPAAMHLEYLFLSLYLFPHFPFFSLCLTGPLIPTQTDTSSPLLSLPSLLYSPLLGKALCFLPPSSALLNGLHLNENMDQVLKAYFLVKQCLNVYLLVKQCLKAYLLVKCTVCLIIYRFTL